MSPKVRGSSSLHVVYEKLYLLELLSTQTLQVIEGDPSLFDEPGENRYENGVPVVVPAVDVPPPFVDIVIEVPHVVSRYDFRTRPGALCCRPTPSITQDDTDTLCLPRSEGRAPYMLSTRSSICSSFSLPKPSRSSRVIHPCLMSLEKTDMRTEYR